MEYFWRTSSLKQDVARRLEGGGATPSNYKYNSLLVLDRDPDKDPLYHFPRHDAAKWVLALKGVFLTVVSLADNILKEEEEEKEKKEVKKEECGSPGVYNIELQVQGGPVYCCIVDFAGIIFIMTSDSCMDMSRCAIYLHDTLPHLIPAESNALLNPACATSSRHVVDSFVAPALEIVGTTEWINLPFRHRGHRVSKTLQEDLLRLETKIEMTGEVCVSCGGVVLLSYPDVVYSSLPPSFQPAVLQTLFYRSVLSLTPSQSYYH